MTATTQEDVITKTFPLAIHISFEQFQERFANHAEDFCESCTDLSVKSDGSDFDIIISFRPKSKILTQLATEEIAKLARACGAEVPSYDRGAGY